MAEAATIAAIAAVIGTGAGIAGTVMQSQQAASAASTQQNQIKKQKEALAQQKITEQANKVRDTQRSMQRTAAMNAGGRASTILSSPLPGTNLTGLSPAPGKSLLGV